MIFVYRIITNILIIFSPFIILFRLIKKKENPKRFLEKFSFFSEKRKKGKLVWFHTVSVGELLSIFPLLKLLEKNSDISQILITTSTITSANLFQKIKIKKSVHQFFPLDNNFFIKKFLNYWSPQLAIFVDSEIWPNLLLNLKKKNIRKILLNARISRHSFRKWKTLGTFSEKIFQLFDCTYPQNNETKKFLKNLKVKKIKEIGNLKYSQKDYYFNRLPNRTKKFFKSKQIFCAASTHEGEEKLCAEVFKKLRLKHKKLILFIIPRHIQRVELIQKELAALNMNFHVHSSKKPIDAKTNIYIVDTFGDTGLFFQYSKIVFMGKSIKADGGQNPLEPARRNCRIIYGPKISNFTDIYSFLKKQKIAFKVNNKRQMFKIINKHLIKNIKKNDSDKINLIGKKILNEYFREVQFFLK